MSNGIICLCGSTRFKKEFNDINYYLTLHNYIVLTVGSFLHSDTNKEIREDILRHKKQLDKLHKEKIAMSDAIVVIDVNGYTGDSTRSEINYARKLNKKIFWYSNLSYLNLGHSPFMIRRLEIGPRCL